jgi:hypothetical protein
MTVLLAVYIINRSAILCGYEVALPCEVGGNASSQLGSVRGGVKCTSHSTLIFQGKYLKEISKEKHTQTQAY